MNWKTYLKDANDDNVEEKLAEYRSALKAEYSELRRDFQESFPYIIPDDKLEVSSSFVFYDLDYEVKSYWDLNQDIKDVLAYDEVKLVTAYTLYHVDNIVVCYYTYCIGEGSGGGSNTSSGGPSNGRIDPKYAFSNIRKAIRAENLAYTGANVKVGVLDGGAIRTENPGFWNRQVIRRDENTASVHGTNVANVAFGNGGIARGTIVYSATASGGGGMGLVGLDNISQLQWFVDNGVSLVNLSIGLYYQHDYEGVFQTYPEMIDPTIKYIMPVMTIRPERDYWMSESSWKT